MAPYVTKSDFTRRTSLSRFWGTSSGGAASQNSCTLETNKGPKWNELWVICALLFSDISAPYGATLNDSRHPGKCYLLHSTKGTSLKNTCSNKVWPCLSFFSPVRHLFLFFFFFSTAFIFWLISIPNYEAAHLSCLPWATHLSWWTFHVSLECNKADSSYSWGGVPW